MSISLVNRCLLRRAQPLILTCRIIDTSNRNSLIRNKSEVITYDEEENPNAPIKFSTSRAANWKSNYKKLTKEEDADPERRKQDIFRWSSYLCSYVVLLIYLMIREGNDWDDEQAMPLGKRMLLLQEYQLRGEREENIRNHDDVDEIDEQLRKIAKLMKQYNYV